MRARCSSSGLSASVALVLALASLSRVARADVDLGALARAAAVSSVTKLPGALANPGPVLVELPQGAPAPRGFVSITPGFGVLELDAARLFELSQARPELRFEWTPPRRLLMDRADGFVRASSFRNDTGLTGEGVVVGIVDSGIDPTNTDLRGENGRSRILWWLDFSRAPLGLHPELEDELGCTGDNGEARCAVLDGNDVENLLVNGESADDPADPVGHGTHVASLAGGSGLSSDPPRFTGVAPGSSFVVVRAIRPGGGIFDADILRGTEFVFDRATEASMPAVVNLSLGSDFGGHDGSSALERGLESMVGPGHPGRAIVVAAGNSAGLVDGIEGVPGPCGVHTEVHVPRGERALVPIVTLSTTSTIRGALYAWVATRPGDALSIGVVDSSGSILAPVPTGHASVVESDGVTLSVANGVHGGSARVPEGSDGAVVIVDGAWSRSRSFALELEGPASARIWVLGEGDLASPESYGPLVPRARKEGTINVPASSPGLIAVGATLNRTDWVDYAGEHVSFPRHGALEDAPSDSTAFFSSAGPNALGGTKPDIVAPGANVVGAMAATADPRFTNAPLFSFPEACLEKGYTRDCFVVDDRHAVTSGTSMSAPLVTGAVALLFERDPTLDQSRVRALLQAGSRPLEGVTVDARQVGPGALDLEGTLDALGPEARHRAPGSATRLALAASFAHPDSSWPLEGLVLVRDDDGRVADDFADAALELDVHGAEVVRGLSRVTAGLFSFAVAAPPGSGGRTLSIALRLGNRTLAKTSVPIAVDPALATSVPAARGGCSMGGAEGTGAPHTALAALTALFVVLRVRRAVGREMVARGGTQRARRERLLGALDSSRKQRHGRGRA